MALLMLTLLSSVTFGHAGLIQAGAQPDGDEREGPLALSRDGRSLVPADSADALVPVPDGVSERGVDPVFVGHHPIAAGDAVWLAHGGLVWTLAVRSEAPWVLELGDHPHRMEPVHTWSGPPTRDPVLRWAGDLDEDGLLDVVIDLSTGPLLFLSSRHVAVALD